MCKDKDSVKSKIKEIYANYGIIVEDDDIELASELYLANKNQLKKDLEKSRKFKNEQEGSGEKNI